MFTIDSNFIGEFKVGDNINHNLKILNILYRHLDSLSADEQTLLYKPIFVTLVSVAEAILYDLHYRISHFTKEGVGAIEETTLKTIRSKKIKRLDQLIACVKKHNLLGMKKNNLYDKFDELRKIRNRIHIQNTHGEFERDEEDVFTAKRKIEAEKVLEKIMKKMVELYLRKGDSFVENFSLPWTEHF